jgi:excisionase family DNA binding protein
VTTTTAPAAPRFTFTVREAARALGCSEWKVYESIRSGTCPVEVVRIGRKVVIPTAALEQLLHLEPGALTRDEGVSNGEVAR